MSKGHNSPFAIGAFTIAAGFLIGTSVILMNQMPGRAVTTTKVEASNSNEVKTMQLDNLRVSVNVPERFEQVIGIQYADFIGTEGKINISRIATDYDNLVDYLNEFDSLRNISTEEENSIQIDGYEAVSRKEIFGPNQPTEKSYKIYIEGWVYSMSTSDEPMYSYLDQMATSFRYLP